MTIARDRWQHHLKSRGGYYHDQAADLESLARTSPTVGADVAALAFHGLSEVMEQARIHRLTRHQHVLFRLGEIVAYVESAGALCRRAAAALDGTIAEKADERFEPEALAAISRVFVREAAAKLALDGTRWVLGAGEPGTIDAGAFEAAVGTKAIQQAQTGLISDMDLVADAIYQRG
jgi:hypothetical protein